MCGEHVGLVDHMMWTEVPSETDPFRPATEWGRGPCTRADMYYEDFEGEPSYTVVTQYCSWTTVEQPLLFDVAAGEPINVRVWCFSQTTEEVAEATLLVAAGEEPLWQRSVPLPAVTGELLFDTLPAPHALPSGTPVRWHLQNHGENSWNLIELSVTRRTPCASSSST